MSKGTSDAKKRILEIRSRILGFHERIYEITATGVVKYGRGKTKLCAEIRLDSSDLSSPPDSSPKRPFLWLYLPIIHMGKPAVGRMQVWTNDWNNIQSINYIPLGKRSGRRYNIDNLEQYNKLAKATNQSNQLDILVDIALEAWLSRL